MSSIAVASEAFCLHACDLQTGGTAGIFKRLTKQQCLKLSAILFLCAGRLIMLTKTPIMDYQYAQFKFSTFQ